MDTAIPDVTPAPAPAPAVLTPLQDAVAKKDFPAFRAEKDRALRAGEPSIPAPVEAKPAAEPEDGDELPPAAATPERPVSKRQQQINDLHRQIAERDAELARLKADRSAPAPRREEPPTAPALAPDADPMPQEADFATNPDPYAYLDARAAWNARREFRTQQQKAAETAAQAQRAQAAEQTVATATERIQAYAKTDPEFTTKVNPDLLEVVPLHRLPDGAPIGNHNVLAEEILTSEHTPKLLLHFSTDEGKQEWARLCRMRGPEMLRAFGRLEAKFDAPAEAEPAKPAPKILSDAPAPPPVLGRKPAAPVDEEAAALQRRDFPAYRAAKDRRLRAQLAGR